MRTAIAVPWPARPDRHHSHWHGPHSHWQGL